MGRFEWERALHRDAGITKTRHHVLVALATFADRDGRVTAGEKKLAEATGLSVSTVREHLSAARQAGLLQRVSRGHRLGSGRPAASVYVLTVPSQPPAPRRLDDASTASVPAVEGPSQPPAEPVSTASLSPLNRQPPGGIHVLSSMSFASMEHERSHNGRPLPAWLATAVDVVAERLTAATGRTYDPDDIADSVRAFLRGKDVTNPAAYVRKCADENPLQFEPTPSPPRYRREDHQ
ncbi:MAG: hypothetical protein ACRDSL_03020 [Pseudonocardiaceae bacterium]